MVMSDCKSRLLLLWKIRNAIIAGTGVIGAMLMDACAGSLVCFVIGIQKIVGLSVVMTALVKLISSLS